MSPDNLEFAAECSSFRGDARSSFDTARSERLRQRIERAESEALSRAPTETSRGCGGLQVETRVTKLCHLIVCVLPKLDGVELEYIWSKMEELAERRRAAELAKRKAGTR